MSTFICIAMFFLFLKYGYYNSMSLFFAFAFKLQSFYVAWSISSYVVELPHVVCQGTANHIR